MVEADATLEKAMRASQRRQRDRRTRLLWSAATSASYALDALFLGLFVAAGTVPLSVLLAFACAATVICASVFAMYATGLNLRLREGAEIWPQTLAGVAVHLMVVALAPQVAFPMLANLFTVFAFGLLWLSPRASLVLWVLTASAFGLVLWWAGDRAGMAASTAFEAALTWASFSAVLARCLILSANASDMRQRLADSRRRLAASLEQVQDLASHDELTRSLNRRSLMAALERERSRAERSGAPFCVALIDLDHFKQVNDIYGHSTGDAVLRDFAASVHRTMRVTDVFGRYGGEEFLMILVGNAQEEAILALERIRAAIAAVEWTALTPGRTITFSAGVASFRKGESIVQLINRADRALYEAKGAGRNQVRAHTE
jgi:diguanylate cyclase (GGDEF)-like protein